MAKCETCREVGEAHPDKFVYYEDEVVRVFKAKNDKMTLVRQGKKLFIIYHKAAHEMRSSTVVQITRRAFANGWL